MEENGNVMEEAKSRTLHGEVVAVKEGFTKNNRTYSISKKPTEQL